MHLVCNRTQLLQVLSPPLDAVDKSPSSAALSGVKLDYDGRTLTVTGSDRETTIVSTTNIASECPEPGVIVVPSKLIMDIVKSFKTGDMIDIQSTSENTIAVTNGKTTFNVQCYDRETYPIIPALSDGDEVKLPTESFRNALTRVMYAASDDKSRPVLQGIHCVISNGTMTLAATDSYRLAAIEIPISSGVESDTIIPSDALASVAKHLDVETDWIFYTDSLTVSISDGNTTVKVRTIQGSFPNIGALLGNKPNLEIRIDRKDLLETLTRVRTVSGTQFSVSFLDPNVEDGTLVVRAFAEGIGEAREVLPVEFVGETTMPVFSCNPRYLVDFLKAVDDDSILLGITDSIKPLRFTTSGEDEAHILMPVRQGN